MTKVKLFLFVAIAVVALGTNAQIGGDENKFSVDVNYPFLIGDNASSEYNKGSIDFGLKYNFIHITKIDLGISTDVGVITGDNIDGGYYIKPRLNGEIKIWKINPYVGLGYTFINSKSKFENGEDFNESGINATIGLKWHLFIPKLYLNAAYDFTSLNLDGDDISAYDKNFEIFKIGVGLQF